MTYRVALTYHPDVGTFRGKRGAWRVYDPDLGGLAECTEDVYPSHMDAGDGAWGEPVVVLPACRKYRRGTWVNPLKILKEYQSTKRSNTQ